MVDFVDERITWTKESYTLSTFLETSEFPLPAVIKIKEGFYGMDDYETFPMDEVIYELDWSIGEIIC